jgi:hypothetical protein
MDYYENDELSSSWQVVFLSDSGQIPLDKQFA